MQRILKSLAFAAAVLALSGCAGTNFVRPDTSFLVNGQTTYAQIVARMGKPRAEGTVLKNEKTINTATYGYATTGGQPLHPGVTPARVIAFYHVGGTLVGHEFISSFAEDHSNFDENKVKDIVKGKTTRAELVQLLGRPAGAYVYPMIKAETGDAAVYMFQETSGSVFTLKFFRKALIVTLNVAGVVTDVDYSSSGNR